MTKDLQDWALANERTYGLGAGTIEGYVGKIGDLTQGMGLGKKESLDMAKGAMQLGVQLANWNGVDADTAMNDLTAALAGSHKAMDKYGVKLNQTVLDEQTRSMGLGDTFNKLTEAQKAQVRYEAIMKASGNAIQFWNEGNRSTAFYLNEIKEQVGNVMEVVGGLFLPILDKVVKKVADWTANIAAFLSENPKLVEGIVLVGGGLAALGPGMLIIGKLMTIFAGGGIAAAGLGVLTTAIGILSVAFIGLNENAASALLELPDKAQIAIGSFLQNIVEALPGILEKGTEMLFKLVEGIALGVPVLIEFMYNSMMNLYGLLFNFGPKFLEIGFDFIKNMLDGAIKKFPEFLGKMMDGILNVLKNIRAELPEFLKNGIAFVGEMIKGIAQNMPKIISKIGELLAKLIGKIIEYLPKFLAEGFKLVGEMIKGIWNNKGALLKIGSDLIKGLWDSIKAVCSSFLKIGKSIVDNIKQGVADAWGSFTNWVSNKVQSIPVVGKLFRSVENSEGENTTDTEDVPATYGISTFTRAGLDILKTSNFNTKKIQGVDVGNSNIELTEKLNILILLNSKIDKLIEATLRNKVTKVMLDERVLVEQVSEPIIEEIMWKGKRL